jgi:hypothetical protein
VSDFVSQRLAKVRRLTAEDRFEDLERDGLEIKPVPASGGEGKPIHKTTRTFLNPAGGILLLCLREDAASCVGIRGIRLAFILPWLVLISSCSPVVETMTEPVIRAKVVPTERKETTSPPAGPATPPAAMRAGSGEFSGILFEGVAFDSQSHRLVVADQAGGPDSRFADAAAAASALDGLAAINAGFFTPAGDPLGLVVSGGNPAGSWNSASSLGSGLWYENPSGEAAITRRESLGRSRAATMRELMQAGPMLVENGRAVPGLEAEKTSVRTVILWDGGHCWWIGRAAACTLAELGKTLASHRPGGWAVRHALNLDGGRSADLWISAAIPGGPVTRRPAWNRPVRNFLILVRR